MVTKKEARERSPRSTSKKQALAKKQRRIKAAAIETTTKAKIERTSAPAASPAVKQEKLATEEMVQGSAELAQAVRSIDPGAASRVDRVDDPDQNKEV